MIQAHLQAIRGKIRDKRAKIIFRIVFDRRTGGPIIANRFGAGAEPEPEPESEPEPEGYS